LMSNEVTTPTLQQLDGTVDTSNVNEQIFSVES